jgi:5,10-methenyltetrahydromethanopterin hydrogenase
LSPRSAGRIATCGTVEAATRLAHAHAFLEVADLVGDQEDELATPNVAASLAVLAGIAASDAVCCAALGQRARGQDHRQAADLLGEVVEIGEPMARDLRRLLAIKDDAHYGVLHVSQQRVTAAIRQAIRLVKTAEAFIEESP